MLKKLALGAASGYVLKLVQILSNLILVPFLISSKALGLAGYGTLVALLAAVALISTGLDGWRLSTARRFGLSKSTAIPVYIPLLIVSLIPIGLFALLLIFGGKSALDLIGLEEISPNVVRLLILYCALEQLIPLAEQYFHSIAKTAIVNIVSMVEVLLRTPALLLLLKHAPSIEMYFATFTISMAIKFTIYNYFLYKAGQIKAFSSHAVKQEWPTLFESLPLSVKGLSSYVVFRGSVVIINKIFSPEIAAIFSILIFTIRGYINQLFVAVLRPMIIPVMATIDLKNAYEPIQLLFCSGCNLFKFCVMLFNVVLVFSAPWWVPLWLGPQLTPHTPLLMIGMIFLGLEASTSVQYLVLVSQGHGGSLTRLTLITSLLYVGYLIILTRFANTNSLIWFIVGVFVYIFITSGLLVPRLFEQKIIKMGNLTITKQTLFSAACILSAWLLTANSGSLAAHASVVTALIAAYTLLIYNPLGDQQLRTKLRFLRKQ